MLLETGRRGGGGGGGLKRNRSKIYLISQPHFHGLSCGAEWHLPDWQSCHRRSDIGCWLVGGGEAPLKVNRDNRKPGRKEGRRGQLSCPQICLFIITVLTLYFIIIIFFSANECVDCCVGISIMAIPYHINLTQCSWILINLIPCGNYICIFMSMNVIIISPLILAKYILAKVDAHSALFYSQ